MGMASSRSSPLPCGTPSMMSISTTSQSSFAAIQCAAVAPTFPEPTTVTFFLIIPHSINDLATSSCIEVLKHWLKHCQARQPGQTHLVLLGCQLCDRFHVVDHMGRELTGLDLGRAFQHPFE